MDATASSNAASESSKQRYGAGSEPVCIVITGASSGLGAGLSRNYAAPGRVLGLIGRNASRLAEVAASCRQRGAVTEIAVLDVTDQAAVANWLRMFDDRTPIDMLIANAGISAGTQPDGQMEGVDAAREVVLVNLLGVIHCVEPLLPRMLRRGRGQIAVVASMAAYRGLPDSPAYCASKAGVLAYGESLRGALEPRGITVSVIVPGFFASPMSGQFRGSKMFLLSEVQAVARVVRGLRLRSGRIVFPWQLRMMLRLVNLLPPRWGDRIIGAFRFHISDRRA